MYLISNRKVSLIFRLIISYVILLIFGFLVFLFTAVPSTDIASVSASLLSWTATLYTPVAAYLLYDSWKDQKSYELKKSLIENIIESLTATRYPMLKRIRHATSMTKINEKVIIFKNINSINNIEGETLNHIKAYANIEIYEKLTNDKEIKNIYRWYESYCMRLNSLHRQISDIYQSYYQKLDKELLKDLGEDTIRSKEYDTIDLKYTFAREIDRMQELMKVNDLITYHGEYPISYSKTYYEITAEFENKVDELITLLVKEIKL